MNINKSGVNIDYVEMGDRVRMVFKHYAPMNPEKVHDSGRVIQKIHRYGYVNDGQTPTKPLIRFISDVTGEERFSDSGFIVEILEKRKGPQTHYNFYRYEVNRERVMSNKEAFGGKYYHGFPDMIITFALAQLNMNIPRSLDHERLFRDFMKLPFIKIEMIEWNLVRVQKKKLKKWLRRNVNRYLLTVKEIEQRDTEYNKEAEAQYWAEMDKYFEEEIENIRPKESLRDLLRDEEIVFSDSKSSDNLHDVVDEVEMEDKSDSM